MIDNIVVLWREKSDNYVMFIVSYNFVPSTYETSIFCINRNQVDKIVIVSKNIFLLYDAHLCTCAKWHV